MIFRNLSVLFLSAASVIPCNILQAQRTTPGTLASATPPVYPLAAKAAGIEGKVEMKGTIAADGRLRDLMPVTGPVELRQAAMDAASHWVYHPYKDHGIAVATPTKVVVTFTLGNKKQKAAAQAAAQAELAKQGTQPAASLAH